jgi:outer membrane protein assembly factor BamB
MCVPRDVAPRVASHDEREASHVTTRWIAWVLTTPLILVPADDASWTSWGGPTGDFHVAGAGELTDSWPESGPLELWNVELGDGYSSILYRDGRLFTMYRDETIEIAVALDAGSGDVLWDFAYEAGRYPEMDQSFGEGPNATPLLLGDRLITVGVTGKVHALSAKTGDPFWELDLHERFGRQERREEYGYSASPLAYAGKVLILVGGDEHAVVALDPADGSVAWGSGPGRVSYAPARLVRLAGRDQLVYFSPTEVIGMDPTDGTFLWSYPVECHTENNLTSAMLLEEDTLWVACQLDGGTRVLRIGEEDGALVPEALWTKRTLRQGHWTSVRVGDHVYGSIGDSNSMFGAVNWRTGETAWRVREFQGSQVLLADDKLVFVEENGHVVLARPSPEGFELLASHRLLEPVAWTAPTLVGTTLFVRDRERVLALDLARSSYEG